MIGRMADVPTKIELQEAIFSHLAKCSPEYKYALNIEVLEVKPIEETTDEKCKYRARLDFFCPRGRDDCSGSALREARDQVRKGFEREEILSGQLKEVELSEGEPFFDNVENLRVLRACLSFED